MASAGQVTCAAAAIRAFGSSRTIIGRVLTFLYFAFFISMPIWTKLDKTKPVPQRVTMHD